MSNQPASPRITVPGSRVPRITVIMATYNSSKTMKLAIESLLAQDFNDYEAWIIGDACTDDSEEVVASFGDERLHWANLSQNIGSQAGPNNEGLRRARGAYVAYLGHDDLWFPWHLSGLLAYIEKSQADLVHPLSADLRPSGLARVVGPPPNGKSYANHFVFPSSWLHRREAVLACGGWRDPNVLYRGVDMDLLYRLAIAGKRIEFYPQLSLLKFPSAAWGIYAWQGIPPQQGYLQRILEAPQELYQQCLMDMAVLCARQADHQPKLLTTLKTVAIQWRDKLFRYYGQDRLPLRQYLVWKYQRKRRFYRKIRGLA